MEFLSEQLVSSDYRMRLNQDLQNAQICRFLVAYISGEGINAIGRNELITALQDERSFGVGSLTCACGWTPLVELQDDFSQSMMRLKYFMDPRLQKTDEPDDIVLLHSKLVYLYLPETGRSVVYIGSHNWTSRALGPNTPRNAEASIRFELPFEEEHLFGQGESIASEVNRHLLAAYNTAACLPAVRANEITFDQWYQWTCKKAPRTGLDMVTILLAVRTNNGTTISASEWAQLERRSIYMPALSEVEGRRIREDNNRILIMVWNTTSDLAAGRQPIILRCHLSTQDPAPTSEVRGSNQAPTPIAGFAGIIFDEAQLIARQTQNYTRPNSVQVWSGRTAEYYDLEYPTARPTSSAVDGGVQPTYRLLLEIDRVVFPTEGASVNDPEMMWTPESFAVARTKDEAKAERVEGYVVSEETKNEILASLVDTFGVDTSLACTLPLSGYDSLKEGRRFSEHPLHDTFIGPEVRQRKEHFYGNTSRGSLVANLDASDDDAGTARQVPLFEDCVSRVDRLFTLKLDRLDSIWSSTARLFKERRRNTQ